MQPSIEQEQVTELYNRAPSGTIGQIIVTFLMVYLLYRDVTISVLAAWAVTMLLILCIRLIFIVLFHLKNKSEYYDIKVKKCVLFYQVNVFLTGTGWGLVTYLFSDQIVVIDLQVVMAAIIFAIAGIGIASLGPIFKVYASYSIPMISLFIYHIYITDRPFSYEFCAISFLGMVLLLVAALQVNHKTLDLIKKIHQLQRRD